MPQERAAPKRQETQKHKSATQSTRTPSVVPTQSATLDVNLMTPPDVLALQRQVGNRAVMRIMKDRSPAKRGQGLPDQLEGALGKAFGSDLSGVQVHTDATANQIARTANADATTIGQDIYFRSGAYNPGTAQGNALIARELAYIEQGRSAGNLNDHTSSEASAAERRDADNVSGFVASMGANPAQVLQPINQKPTQAQRRVLQRDGTDMEEKYSHMRSAGIASSKIVQGVFTTILGPLSLVWRWPLIQKNIGEAMGDDVGTWEKKPDDKLRYGTGKLGDAMRFMTVTSEILKELLIWCGFASLITAIVAGATHGALTPVFVAIAIITAIIGGVVVALKFTTAALNTYRYFNHIEKGADGKKERAHTKAQIANDLWDGIGALFTTVFAALGAGGVTATVGGVSAKELGFTEGAAKGVGAGINAGTQGLVTSAFTNTGKESFKEAGKAGKEHGFFGGKKGVNKKGEAEEGGFFKDKLVIKAAYKGLFADKNKAAVTTPQPQVTVSSPDAKQALDQINFVASKTPVLQVEQQKDSKRATDASNIIADNSGGAIKVADDVKGIKTNLADSQEKGKAVDSKLEDLVVVKNDSEADSQESKINDGLAKIGELKISGVKKPSLLSQIGTWFAKRIRGIKSGTRRLFNWIMKGVMRFASWLDKSGTDPASVAAAMSEEKSGVADVVTTEQQNTQTFANINEDAVKSQKGIVTLAEREGSGQ